MIGSRWIAERVSSSAMPGDWVYVHNFQQPNARFISKPERVNGSKR